MDLARDMVVSQIVSRLSQAVKGPVLVEGTWGSFARLLTAHISKTLHRPVLHVCPHIDDADRAFDDLKTFGVAGVDLLPAWEGEEDLADATDETRSERLRIVSLLANSNGGKHAGLVIAAPVQALCQPIPKPSALRESSLELKRNDALDPEVVVEWLVNNSFERVDAVDLPGQFARRGGIIDIYAPLASEKVGRTEDGGQRTVGAGPRACPNESGQPQGVAPTGPQSQALRIEFFGDTIESIREINLDTQRSTHEIESISIVAAASDAVIEQRELFTNILPEDAIVVFEEPAEVEEVANVFLARIEKAGRLYPWADIHNSAARLTQLHISRFLVGCAVHTFPKDDYERTESADGEGVHGTPYTGYFGGRFTQASMKASRSRASMTSSMKRSQRGFHAGSVGVVRQAAAKIA
jgi:transcription-repair coupling factor (superfamily II helicase)